MTLALPNSRLSFLFARRNQPKILQTAAELRDITEGCDHDPDRALMRDLMCHHPEALQSELGQAFLAARHPTQF